MVHCHLELQGQLRNQAFGFPPPPVEREKGKETETQFGSGWADVRCVPYEAIAVSFLDYLPGLLASTPVPLWFINYTETRLISLKSKSHHITASLNILPWLPSRL